MEYFHPLYFQLEELVAICRKYNKLYIYGDAANQRLLDKYLKVCCGIKISGFVTTQTLSTVKFGVGTALILGLSDKYYNEIFPCLEQQGIKNVIFLPEYAKQEIARKMRVLSAEETLIEVNLADHCNLNCSSCDHFSPIAKPRFPDINEFGRDMARLAELSERRLGSLALLGGEPLINHETPKFIELARKELPETEIDLYTNGILLLNSETDDVWRALHEYNAAIKLTRYPIKLDMYAVYNKANQKRVRVEIFQTHAGFAKYTLNIKADSPLFAVPECYQFNHCSVLRSGRIYMCPLSAHIDKFNAKHGQTFDARENDSIDIYTAQSFEEIAEFTSRPVPFCRYCDIGAREMNNWRTSERSI